MHFPKKQGKSGIFGKHNNIETISLWFVNSDVYLLTKNVISLLEIRKPQSNSIRKNQLIFYNMLHKIHHIAVICSNYEASKRFYIDILGLEVIKETYREERDSYKLDLALKGQYVLELFSFPHPPKRPSRPESTGLRHLAFEVDDLDSVVAHLNQQHLFVEPIRIDHITNKRFTFTADPDDLPIEFYEK